VSLTNQLVFKFEILTQIPNLDPLSPQVMNKGQWSELLAAKTKIFASPKILHHSELATTQLSLSLVKLLSSLLLHHINLDHTYRITTVEIPRTHPRQWGEQIPHQKHLKMRINIPH
jgi:hypothetical protein